KPPERSRFSRELPNFDGTQYRRAIAERNSPLSRSVCNRKRLPGPSKIRILKLESQNHPGSFGYIELGLDERGARYCPNRRNQRKRLRRKRSKREVLVG